MLQATSKMNAPGGEGYLLSREGARKLLEILARRKIFMEVDWLIFFHCLSPEQRGIFIAKDATRRFDMLEFDDLVLNSAVLQPSLLEQVNSKSTIGFDNPKNYIFRDAMRGGLQPRTDRPAAENG
jgi:GR25 family glycosyltransferase involved in LPS biosynthesis